MEMKTKRAFYFTSNSIVLYCILFIAYCIVLYCIVLFIAYCIVLYCIVL